MEERGGKMSFGRSSTQMSTVQSSCFIHLKFGVIQNLSEFFVELQV